MTVTATDIVYFGANTDESELDRLVRQDAFFGEFTTSLLLRAGVSPGMRVLDLGSGAGDVAIHAARIVGPGGSVVGVDREESAIGYARQRTAKAGLDTVAFAVADLDTYAPDGTFDAIVGRMVLSYLPDPAVTLRRLLRCLAPGGIVAIQEMYRGTTTVSPPVDLLETTVDRIWTTFARLGSDLNTSIRLGTVFEEAGLPTPEMRIEARVERGPASGAWGQITGITRTLLPWMVKLGIATEADVEIDTLEERLRAVACASNSTLISPAMLSAWTRSA